ncbi:hypothetical protein [Acrocarpospora corrugata]|uniref:hypothetical protein n=1 Tax=Acrocarpospora corrugata TaxID=35763 RepID=UPI0012D34272|nr:hypothetical protein [Acrocarpospora corrugata]
MDDRRPTRAALPGIARQLLAAVDARDHWAYLRPAPELIRSHGIEDLLCVLTDEQRRLPAVVASAHGEIPFDSWKQTIAKATRYLPGLASLYILDPLAAREFNDAVGPSYEIRNGSVRTYLPDLDLAIDEDAGRHRVLSEARLQSDLPRSAHLLTALPRRLAADGRLPDPLNKLTRTTVTFGASSQKAVESTLHSENRNLRSKHSRPAHFGLRWSRCVIVARRA